NEQADVALLKTALTDGDALALRSGPAPEVGTDVYAIGSPLGVLNNSMTRGVLSADRVMQGRRVLQSDAAVTFGSSGGPLLDAD
ncbi:S1 family peptidase, partial [Klebsiella pneumoniae]|uniref:S1 family peptidase n=3 Tax=Pseudomonadota TaxID=1224 RepID=UPI002730B820